MLKRVLTGLVLAPLVVLLVAWGPIWAFSLLVLVATGICLNEFLQIALKDEFRSHQYLAIGIGCALVALAHLKPALVSIGLVLGALALFIAFLLKPHPIERSIVRWSTVTAGLVYLPGVLSFLVMLEATANGRWWVLLLFAVVFMGDTGAYFSGRFLGKHKLYEAISPKKTIEGSVGGLLAGIGGAIVCKLLFFGQLTYLDCVLVAVGAGLLEQVGDLCESMLKRAYAVKDSGKLLPGHGGLLDRIDGVLFAAPYVYLYAIYLAPLG